MRARHFELSLHLLRLVASFAALVLVHSIIAKALASALFFFEAFAFLHDLMHGALRLPRRVNEIALTIAGALLGMSGHTLRRSHLRHHARTLADDDLEGAAAKLSFAGAVFASPRLTFALRMLGLRGAHRRTERLENILNLATMIAVLASRSSTAMIWLATTLALQLVMPLWAAFIPHNTPEWMVRAARRLAFLGSPTILSFGYHELHHARPEVPCQRLPYVARSC